MDMVSLVDLAEMSQEGHDQGADQGLDQESEDLGPVVVPPQWLGHCEEVDRFGPVFASAIDKLSAQVEAPGRLLFVGSSSIRRWEGLTRRYAQYDAVQRGVGGVQLGEVALRADSLVVGLKPRAVVVYAGTNDLAAGVSPSIVVERFRCLRERIGQGLGWRVPVWFVGVTPTPSRWSGWSDAQLVNAQVEALAAQDDALYYVDGASAFLSTGQPPDASLFVSDRLHLSATGYALWGQVISAALDPVLRVSSYEAPAALDAGAQVLIDLGPDNPEDGHRASVDGQGRHWNSWAGCTGDGQVLPGERLNGLVDSAGAMTPLSLVISGGFGCNGLAHGGLIEPSAARLGELAVGEATQDFFYADDQDLAGGFFIEGLSQARTYTLTMFGARRADQQRITRYEVYGASALARTVTLQTSGAGAGAAGATINDQSVARLSGLSPDSRGRIFVDMAREVGDYAYVSLIALSVE